MNVLLIGATGFAGSHLLRALLAASRRHLYCTARRAGSLLTRNTAGVQQYSRVPACGVPAHPGVE